MAEDVGGHEKGEPKKEHRQGHETHARIWLLLAFVLYLAVALVMFYPITANMKTVAPGTGADTYQNLWDIWWVNYAVINLHTNAFYTHLLFWPLGASLVDSTIAPLLGLLSAPFQLVGTVFAYNVMFLLGFVLSGLTMYLLAEYLTKNHYASLIAGFVFAFSAFHIAQSYSHIHFMNIEFVPLFVYFFIRLLENDKRLISTVGMSASFALSTLMGNIEQTMILLIGFVFLIVVYLIYSDTRKKMLNVRFIGYMAIFVVLAFAIGSWNYIPIIKAITQPGGLGLANNLNVRAANIEWSLSVGGLFVPSYFNGIFYSSGVPARLYNSLFAPDPVEKVGYIGYTVIVLALFAISRDYKKMLPWTVGAVLFIWLALGPTFYLYSLYHAIPVVNIVREPGRFDLIATMFFAILAAYGSKAVFEKFSHHGKHAKSNTIVLGIFIVIIAIMFIENNGMHIGKSPVEYTSISVPNLYYQLAQIKGNFSVLGVPTFPVGANNTYLYEGEDTYYTSVSHKELVGGYTGRENTTSTLLIYNIPLTVQADYLIQNGTGIYPSPVNENYTNETLLSLFNYNTSLVVLHKKAFSNQQLSVMEGYLVSTFGSSSVYYNDNTTIAFLTTNAISRSLFNSYVSYPVLNYWSSTSLFLNGSYQTFWVPGSPGPIAVYAPYQVQSTRSNPYAEASINTTISFVAFSNVPGTLFIDSPSSGNSTRTIATVGITTRPEKYTANVVMVSGAQGNLLYFVYPGSNSTLLMQNITFSR